MIRSTIRAPAVAVLGLLAMTPAGCFNVSDVSGSPAMLTHQVDDWRDEMIYQVLVDRFADGNPGNDTRVNRTSLARYQGGDWQGLTDRLDYFVSLGVTTLWISPIVRNVDTDAGIDGYHGYWASDLAELNPHFGDLAALRRLVQQAHQRHLRIVLDIVTNHMGQMFYYDINQNGRPDDNVYGGGPNNGFQNPGGVSSTLNQVSEFDPDYNTFGAVQSYTSLGPAGPAPVIFLNMPAIFRVPPRSDRACDDTMELADQPSCNSWQRILAVPDGYHRRGRIVNYGYNGNQPDDQTMLGDFPGGLKDVATENPAVRAAMIEAYARWIELTDIDGFRIDTLKHVEHEFWREFGAAVRRRVLARGKTNFFMFGEAFDGNDALIGSYTQPGEMDSVFYFSQKFRVYRDVFQCEGPTQAVQDLYALRDVNFGQTMQPMGAGAPPRQLLVNFFDNHDVPRFLAGIFDEDQSACPPARVRTVDDFQRLRHKLFAALTYLYTEDGIPCLYYGTEQDFHGANDPSNREVFWTIANDYMTNGDQATDYPTSGETFHRVARLTRIRRAYTALRHGSFDVKWVSTRTGGEEDAGMLAFERNDHSSAATVLVVINTHGGAGSNHTAFNNAPMTTSFAAGTVLTDVLASTAPRTYSVGAGGAVTVDLPAYDSVILVPQGQVAALAP